MKERSPKYKVVLDALAVVERFASSINLEICRDIDEFLKSEDKTEETLDHSSFSREVKQAIARTIRAVLLRNIATVKLLEAEHQRKLELLEEENKRKVELLEAERQRKGKQTWRNVWKGVILILYVLVMSGIYWKENWTLVFLCVPISFVEKLLLDDAYALRIWAWILAKTKTGER